MKRDVRLAALALCGALGVCQIAEGRILVNWNSPERHKMAYSDYRKNKEKIRLVAQDEMRRIRRNARISGESVLEVARDRVAQLSGEFFSLNHAKVLSSQHNLKRREQRLLELGALIRYLRNEVKELSIEVDAISLV